ncbi:MAG: Ig-like domain-containing protein [Lentimicrobiaceae bacterium]|nr:Ig-like domain-containing protein [Lentimicrobiaceae bacterium]
MKNKLFLLFFLFIFILNSCVKEKIVCTITSPAENSMFSLSQSIEVNVEASTTKGSIIQVQLLVDDEAIQSLTKEPYQFTIPPKTIPVGLHLITAVAYNSMNNQEVANVYITIEE